MPFSFADRFAETLSRAEAGDLEAQREAGEVLLKGSIVPRDVESGRSWLLRAIESDDPEAMCLLAHHDLFGGRHGRGALEGWALLQRAAKLDHPPAQHSLGAAIAFGLEIKDEEERRVYFESNGLEASPCQATGWIEKAARGGWPPG
jgi:TPR repeat protein